MKIDTALYSNGQDTCEISFAELALFCVSNGFGLPLHLCLCCYDPVKCGVNLTFRGIFF